MSTAHLLRSSVLRKQIVAVTGLAMVGFIILHLAGNLLIFLGPEAFNGYSKLLHAVPELLWVARIILITALILHVYFTAKLFRENHEAREERYAVENSKRDDVAFARKYMIYTGLLVFFFLFLHLWDFTITSKVGPQTIIPDVAGNKQLGLYGLVWNDFHNWLRSLIYVAAVCSVGLHLSHGIQSMFQTIGINHERYTPIIVKASIVIGIIVAVGFSMIPLYVILRGTPSI